MATLLDQTAPVDVVTGPARRRSRLMPALLALTAIVLGVAAFLALRPSQPVFNGGVIEPPTTLPAFDLQRAGGGRFTSGSTNGRLSLFFFGYTTCPDVCPMTLAQVTQVRRLLGPDGDRLDIYFVSVDPARDTPERLAAYTRAFDPSIVGLTGTPSEVTRAMAPFGAIAERRDVPNSAIGYLVDHSATISLVDQQSRIRLIYPPQATPAEIAADVQQLLR
jgi:protein SCO1/2